MDNMYKGNFGVSDLLPDEAIISRHINNLLETFGYEDVYYTMTGIVVHQTLMTHFQNLCNTYSSEVVLDIWYTMYERSNTNKEIKNA